MSGDRDSRADSLSGLLRAASALLAEAGLEHPREDAELLLLRCLGLARAELLAHPEAPVDAADAARVRDWARRHAAGEPLAYLEGSVGFRRLELAVDRRVLVPRADSEVVVEAALDAIRGIERPRIIDVGTGSGCLLLALLDEHPGATGVGVDISEDALEVARGNAERTGLAGRAEFRIGDFLGRHDEEPWTTDIDLIVSNPPYVLASEELGHGVAEHEPHLALYAPEAGMIMPYANVLDRGQDFYLRPGGSVVFEVGAGHAGTVADFAVQALGYEHVETRRDLGGIERAVVLRLPA